MPSQGAKLLVEELEVDCIIAKDWHTVEAGTVLLIGEMSVSVFLIDTIL